LVAARDRIRKLRDEGKTEEQVVAAKPLADLDAKWASPANPLFAEIEQPGIGRYPMPGLPLDFAAAPRQPTRPAPRLGEHTDEVLAALLGLDKTRLADLRARSII